MVDVSMGQDNGFDAAWLDRKRRPVFQAQRLKALEQPAVHENSMFPILQCILRAGDRSSAPQERQFQGQGGFLAAPRVERATQFATRPRVVLSVGNDDLRIRQAGCD